MHRQRRRDNDDDFYELGSRVEHASDRRFSAEAEALFKAPEVARTTEAEPLISRRDQYDALPEEEKRRGRRPLPPQRTGTVKWFNTRQGFGFVQLGDGVDAFLPARALRGEDAPPGATITVRVAESPKGLEVIEVVGDIDLTTAKEPQVGRQPVRRELGEPEWTAEGIIDPKDWRTTYGFVTTEDNRRIFISGAVIGACGYPTETVIGRRVEIGVVRTDRGPAVAKIRIIGSVSV